ncbi:hypothetical protein D3C81_777650 [compost metagenome]
MIGPQRVVRLLQQGQAEIAVAFQPVRIDAGAEAVAAAEGIEFAIERQVDALVGGAVVEHAAIHHHAGQGGGIERALAEHVFHVMPLARVVGAGFQRPVGVETVLEFGEDGRLFAIPAVPVGAQEGRTGQVRVAAVAEAGHAGKERRRMQFFIAGARRQLAARRQVEFQHAVQHVRAAVGHVIEIIALVVRGHGAATDAARLVQGAGDVHFAAHVVPAARAERQLHLLFRQRALAHHVDGGAGRTGALQQARGAAHDFHPVQHGRIAGKAVRLRVVHGAVHAVELVRVDHEAARIHIASTHGAVVHGDAGGIGQHGVDGVEVLVIHLLARDDADGLGNFAQGLHALADGDGARRIRVAVLTDGVALHAGADRYGRHGLFHAGRRCGGWRRLAQHVGAVGQLHRFQAAAGQHLGKALRHAKAAAHAGRTQAARLRGIGRQADAGGDGKVIQGRRQRAGRNSIGLRGGGRGGLALRQRGGGDKGGGGGARHGEEGQADGARGGMEDGGGQLHARSFCSEG